MTYENGVNCSFACRWTADEVRAADRRGPVESSPPPPPEQVKGKIDARQARGGRSVGGSGGPSAGDETMYRPASPPTPQGSVVGHRSARARARVPSLITLSHASVRPSGRPGVTTESRRSRRPYWQAVARQAGRQAGGQARPIIDNTFPVCTTARQWTSGRADRGSSHDDDDKSTPRDRPAASTCCNCHVVIATAAAAASTDTSLIHSVDSEKENCNDTQAWPAQEREPTGGVH